MYQEYQNDQFQDEEQEQNLNRLSTNKKRSEQEMNNYYVSKESILPKILSGQKSVNQNSKIKSTKEKKVAFSSLQSQQYDSIPKKSFSQYSVFKRKSRNNRFQSLDVNKSKTIEKQQKQFLQKNNKKKSNLVLSIKLKNSVSINKNEINLRNSNPITRRLALNTTNQSQLQKVQKYLSHSKLDLQKMNQDQLNRINNRLHQWIQKFNRRLDQILTNWISQQGKKKNTHQNNTEKIVEVLQKHVSNNNDLIVRIDQENKRLQYKRGQLKEQQYQFLLYKQIDRIKSKIKEQAKNIIDLKKKNQLQGTQIVEQQSSNSYRQKINQIKSQVIKFRKQEDKNKINLQLVQKKSLKIKQNLQKSEQALKNLLRQALQKQIVINQTKLEAKYIQLKAKLQKIKASSNTGLISMQKTVNKINQQNKLLRNQIKQYEQDINKKISFIRENTQFMIQQVKETGKTKSIKSNSILFSYKTHKDSQTQNKLKYSTSEIKQNQNNCLDKQKNRKIQSILKIKEDPQKKELKSSQQVIRQEEESQSKNQNREFIQSLLKIDRNKSKQLDINQFIGLKLEEVKKYPDQQSQKLSMKNKKEYSRAIQNSSESLTVPQQDKKKNSHKLFIKKRNDQKQR